MVILKHRVVYYEFTYCGKDLYNITMNNSREYTCYMVNSDTISNDVFKKLQVFVDNQSIKHPLHPALENMGNTMHIGLLSNIKNKTRWSTDSGEICILEYNSNIIGISCVEHSNIHPELSIGGIRCWLDSDYRSSQLMSKFLLNSNLNWSKAFNKSGMMLTFNDYNKTIYLATKRAVSGKSIGISTIWSDWWKDCIVLDQPLNIRNVMQWCIIKPIQHENIKTLIKDL